MASLQTGQQWLSENSGNIWTVGVIDSDGFALLTASWRSHFERVEDHWFLSADSGCRLLNAEWDAVSDETTDAPKPTDSPRLALKVLKRKTP